MNYDYKKQKEDEAKELEQLRKEKEEREQKEREEKIIADAIEAERQRVQNEQTKAVSAGFPEMVELKDPPNSLPKPSQSIPMPKTQAPKKSNEQIEIERAVNINAMNVFIKAGFSAEKAQFIIKLIVSNKIPNVSIKYEGK